MDEPALHAIPGHLLLLRLRAAAGGARTTRASNLEESIRGCEEMLRMCFARSPLRQARSPDLLAGPISGGIGGARQPRCRYSLACPHRAARTMYNGIGLTTVRGSGTNGYVTRNMAHVSATRSAHIKNGSKDGGMRGFEAPPAPKRANSDILLHNHKRDIEVKCLNLQEKLEEQGVESDEADRRVAELRASLVAKLKSTGSQPAVGSSCRTGETHADAASKDRETLALKDALGISSGYVGGSAFDRELQEREKQDRAAKREAEEEERAELMAILEREQAREERQREKEARRVEKEERKEEKKRRKKHSKKRSRSRSD